MNMDGFLILLIPLMGLAAICRGGRWNWSVVPSSALFNGVFWLGWFGALIIGIIVLFM